MVFQQFLNNIVLFGSVCLAKQQKTFFLLSFRSKYWDFSNQASLLSQTGSHWHLKSMNCVTKRLCTPRTHSHDSTYGFLGTHIFPTNCNKHNESSKLLSNCKIRQKPETTLEKCCQSLMHTKIASRKLLCNYNHLGWVPET